MVEVEPKRNNDPFFARLDPATKARTKELFVYPPESQFPKQPPDNIERVFLIMGKPESGKLIAAIRFASAIAEADKTRSLEIATYQHQGDELYDLNSLITSSHFKKDCIYIVPNVFSYNLPSSALSAEKIPIYRQELAKLNAYLILTSIEAEIPTDGIIAVARYSVDGVNLGSVIKSHLGHYYKNSEDDVVAKLLANIAELAQKPQETKNETDFLSDILKSLNSPKRIGQLFNDLRSAPIKQGEELQGLKELIDRITRTDTTSLRRWFRELNLNTKVFAMLMAILLDNKYELNLFDAEELYVSFVQKARQKRGMDGDQTFIDPRRMGVDDIVANANMSNLNNVLSFKSEAQRRIILDYEVANYQGLLWMLAELLIDQIQPAPRRYARNPAIAQYIGHPDLPRLSFHNAELVLANLVGYIGIYRDKKLEDLLSKLNNSDHNDLIGEVFKPLARNERHHPFLLNELETWLFPRNENGKRNKEYLPNNFVASAYALREVYPLMLQAIPDKLDDPDKPDGPDNNKREKMRQRLFHFLNHMADICGNYAFYIDAYEKELNKALEADFSASEAKGKAISEAEKEKQSDFLNRFVHQHLLNISEGSIVVLLYLIAEIAKTYPEDMVNIIESWLLRGVGQREQETDFEDDREIERLLAVDDVIAIGETQGKIAEEKEAKDTRARQDSMSWHLGMIASVMFFQNIVVTNQDEEKKEQEKEKAAEDKKPQARSRIEEEEVEADDEEEESKISAEIDNTAQNIKEDGAADGLEKPSAETEEGKDEKTELVVNQKSGAELVVETQTGDKDKDGAKLEIKCSRQDFI